MKNLLLSILAILVTVLAVFTFPVSAATAVGTPTENYTIPDLPTNDPSHEEKKPGELFYIKDPTSQTKTSPAAFITDFIGPLAQNKYAVVGDGEWYLNVDINTPGWLYIYEYYPPNNAPSGRWLAYKWQLKQSGIWNIGPFSARPDEPEGQHVYRLWFYGNGQWAATNLDTTSSLIYWTYLKKLPELKILSFSANTGEIKRGESVTLSWNVQGAQSMEIPLVGPVTGASGTATVAPDQDTNYVLIATGLDGRQATSLPITVTVSGPAASTPTPVAPVTPTPPVKTPSLLDQLMTPITLISILSVIVIIILGFLVRLVYKKRWATPAEVQAPVITPRPELPPNEIPARTPVSAPEPAMAPMARLIMPNGLEITLTAKGQSIGRAELARALGLDELCLISHQQFQVTCTDGEYFIEDAGSANGTRLNGEDIKGKGTMSLKDGDTIEAAGVIKLKFSVSEV